MTYPHDQLQLTLSKKGIWQLIIETHPELIRGGFASYLSDIVEIKTGNIDIEYPILDCHSRYERIVGFADFRIEEIATIVRADGSQYNRPDYIYCELKTLTAGFGASLRQIKRYQFHTADGLWLIISPHQEWKEPLLSQGIYWISSDEVMELTEKLKARELDKGKED